MCGTNARPRNWPGRTLSCARCGGREFRKETDILDVWFDSGSSHLAVLTPENDLPWPANMYLEGGDQYRGWFHSSLLVGVALKGAAPYRECATNGWTLDEKGRAMSKSLGIGVEPEEVITEIRRRRTAPVGFVGGFRRGRAAFGPDSGADQRSVRRFFGTRSLRTRSAISMTSIRIPTLCRLRNSPRSINGFF